MAIIGEERAALITLSLLWLSHGVEGTEKVCGQRMTGRVVGGVDAPRGSWPWQLSVEVGGEHYCGATLIHSHWALTAAHCVHGLSPRSLMVVAGRWRLSEQGVFVSGVSQVITPPSYSSPELGSDVALLALSPPMPSNLPTVTPACLPPPGYSPPSGAKCWVTGWGAVQEGVPLPAPGTLQQVAVWPMSARQCQCLYDLPSTGYPLQYSIEPGMMCAGYQDGERDACQGDSGGPLLCSEGDVWLVVGVTSFGDGCGRPNRPGVFSDVPHFSAWVTENTGSSVGPTLPLPTHNHSNTQSETCPNATVLHTDCGRLPGATGGPRLESGSGDAYWPWQVSVRQFGLHICGGAVVSERWVLTAAHCFSNRPINLSDWRVVPGRWDQSAASQWENEIGLKMMVLHPDYMPDWRSSDLALLELRHRLDWSQSVRPVCLSVNSSVSLSRAECWATGAADPALGLPLAVTVSVTDRTRCQCVQSATAPTTLTLQNHTCTQLTASHCYPGDSSMLLVCDIEGVWLLAGVGRSVVGCSQSEGLAVFTNIGSLLGWVGVLLPDLFLTPAPPDPSQSELKMIPEECPEITLPFPHNHSPVALRGTFWAWLLLPIVSVCLPD